MINACNLTAFFSQQLQRSILIEIFDLLVPLVSVKCLSHQLSLLGMERRIAAEHKVQSPFAHKEPVWLSPDDVELFGMLQYKLSGLVGCEVDSW